MNDVYVSPRTVWEAIRFDLQPVNGLAVAAEPDLCTRWCEMCSGEGHRYRFDDLQTCPQCKGRGALNLGRGDSNSPAYDPPECPRCDGHGSVPRPDTEVVSCWRCSGAGAYPPVPVYELTIEYNVEGQSGWQPPYSATVLWGGGLPAVLMYSSESDDNARAQGAPF